MKWWVIFLLLANAVVLFAFSMLESPSGQTQAPSNDIHTIRLVNELNVPLGQDPISVQKQNNEAGVCFDYEIPANEDEIAQVSDFLVEQGLEPVINTQLDEHVKISVFISESGKFDRKMINKINEILLDSKPDVKIAKKVCKGLASIKPDH